MVTGSQTVGLVAIVKDDAAALARLAGSVKPLLSTWTILDTGSTDGTPELAQAAFADIPGALHHGPFIDFASARTRALDLAYNTADWLLVLDADMQVEIHDRLPQLDADAHLLTVRDGTGFDYRLPLLITGRKKWRYEGVTHEYLTADDEGTRQPLDALTVHHSCDGSRRPNKLTDDLHLLTAELARNPADARTVFYLAQTHRDLGNIDEAIVLYRLRAEMGGWAEEAFYARYQLGCLLAANVSFDQGADELLKAWRSRPARIEALRALANSANAVADQAAPPDDVLFVHRDQYQEAN